MQTHKRSNKRWTQQEDNFLRENYTRVSVSTIAEQLERGTKATRTRLERLGCRLSTLERNKPKPKVQRRKYNGWHYDSYGRRYISVKGRGSVAEHRYLVEQKLERRLLRTEHVHHVNCNKKDNRIENLFLFKDAGVHMACHRSLEEVTAQLMEEGIVEFDINTGRYKICKNQ